VATRWTTGLAGEFWRYLVVSALALGVDFGTLIGLVEIFGVHYLFAGAAGFLLGAGTVYAGSVFWVFAHRKLSNPVQEMTIFVLIGVGGLGINEVALWVLTDFAGLYVGISKMGAAGLTFKIPPFPLGTACPSA
jgi:putative flippase GtrA